MKQSEKKALLYVKNNKVFKINKTKLADYFAVEGMSGTWEVRYDKPKDEFSCNCKNIRNSECAHIKAVKQVIKNDRERRTRSTGIV